MSTNNQNSISLFKSLKDDMEKLAFDDHNRLDSIKRRTNMIVANVFGDRSEYLKLFSKIQLFYILPRMSPIDSAPKRRIFNLERESGRVV